MLRCAVSVFGRTCRTDPLVAGSHEMPPGEPYHGERLSAKNWQARQPNAVAGSTATTTTGFSRIVSRWHFSRPTVAHPALPIDGFRHGRDEEGLHSRRVSFSGSGSSSSMLRQQCRLMLLRQHCALPLFNYCYAANPTQPTPPATARPPRSRRPGPLITCSPSPNMSRSD